MQHDTITMPEQINQTVSFDSEMISNANEIENWAIGVPQRSLGVNETTCAGKREQGARKLNDESKDSSSPGSRG